MCEVQSIKKLKYPVGSWYCVPWKIYLPSANLLLFTQVLTAPSSKAKCSFQLIILLKSSIAWGC